MNEKGAVRMVRRLVLVLGMFMPLAFAMVPPVEAQDAEEEQLPVEASSLEGFAYAVTQEYAASAIVTGALSDLSAYSGVVRLSVTVSRFGSADHAGAAYDAMRHDLVPTIERNVESSGMEVVDLTSEDLEGLGDDAHRVTFGATTPDITFDSRYLLAVEGELLFEFIALAIGEEHLGRADAIAGVTLDSEPGEDGAEGLLDVLPERDDPVLDGLVPTTSSQETADRNP